MMLRPNIMLSIGLAILLILGLCTALAGQAMSMSDYTLSTADGLSLSMSADGQITHLQIDGDELVSAPAPALLLRDLSDAGSVVSPNLVGNPGFEDGLAGWARYANSGLDVNVVVSPTHAGDGALQFVRSNDEPAFAAYVSDPVTVVPGQRYRVSAWWRSATGYVSTLNGPPTLWQMTLWRDQQRITGLYVQWFDAHEQRLGDPLLAVPLHWNAANWRLTRRELEAPADAASARVVIGAKLSAETLWVDDVALVPSPEQEVGVTGTVRRCSDPPSFSGFRGTRRNSGELGGTQGDSGGELRGTQGNSGELRGTQGNSEELGGTQGDSGGCLVQSISLPESGLVISVTYTAHGDHIGVHGEIADTTGRDRALDVTWGVPADLEGWSWWDDAHTSRPITDTRTYANAISAIYDGWLPISLYPYAGIAQYPIPNTQYSTSSLQSPISILQSPSSNPGLALALPLDRPQLALLSYDGATGRYGSTFHLGISPQADKVGPRAGFDLVLYRFDPTWGFRDVIARHRALQPAVYTASVSIYDYAGAEQGWYFTESGVQKALQEDAANIYSAQYTAGELNLKLAPSSEPRPTLDETLAIVTDTLSSSRPWDAALARAIVNSAVVDPNGDWSMKKLGVFEWAPDWWEAIWAANIDPDLEDGLASFLMDWRVTPAFTATTQAGAHLDGVQMDNFMAPPTVDLRPGGLAVADWPLTYTPHTYQPAVHNGFALREYLAFLRDYLDTNWGTDRAISINFWGLGNPNYLAEYIDAFGSEGNLKGNGEGQNFNPEILDYRRAIAYGRPYLFANQTDGLTATEAYTYSQMALLYGVHSRRGPNGGSWEPEAEQIVTDTVELVRQYWSAGWEPLTYARADSEDIWIERFGGPESLRVPPSSSKFRGTQGNSGELRGTQTDIHFAIHNRTDLTRTATITVETAPLGLTEPASAVITDIAIAQTIPFSVVGEDIVVDLTLGPRQTRVLQVSGGVAPPTPTPTPSPTATPTATPTPPASQCAGDVNGNGIGDIVDIQTTAGELGCLVYLPIVAANWREPWPTATPTPTPTSSTSVVIDTDPTHGSGPLSSLWRPGIVWQGGGGSWNNINLRLVDYWSELGGFDRIGLVRIVPELDSLARGVYSLAEFAPLVEQVRDHGGRLLVKIQMMPQAYTNTPEPPDACPPNDPGDWRYPYRYARYGVAADQEAAFKALVQDFIRYFSEVGGTVINPELFGDSDPHPTLGMPNVLYEVWNEPNYEYEWCDTEENFWHLYQLTVEAAGELRAADSSTSTRGTGQAESSNGASSAPGPLDPPDLRGTGDCTSASRLLCSSTSLLPFTIGGPGWRHETLRNANLPPAFGAPDCLAADDPDCGAIRRFYDFLHEQSYLENGHLSWWSYSYAPREVTTGSTGQHLDNIHTILNDPRYEGRYASTLVFLGEWAPPFRNTFIDLLPDDEWADEYEVLFGRNINDDNEVGASLVPARIWDMTQVSPPPDLQSYAFVGEGPQYDYLPLFKGTIGVFTSQTTGLVKGITNVFRLLNRLEAQELTIDYPPNNRLNLIATADENADRVAVLGWYHVNIRPYETEGVVQYDDLLAGLEANGIGPVTTTLSFENLTPGATYTQTVYVVDQTHSNAFSYRHAVFDDLMANCGANPNTWERTCVYSRVDEINTWTLDTTSGAASVALESTTSILTADDQGRAEVAINLEPYSVWLVVLER